MKRRLLWIAGSFASAAALAALATVVVVHSSWFYGKVRDRLVSTVETATGGRAEIGSFAFDWRHMRAQVKTFIVHGTEPAGKPPLFQAASVTVELKIVSLIARGVDIRSLDIDSPRINLIVYPDGRTNLPEPKVKSANPKNPVETILTLAIGRFSVERGEFEVESRGKTPFHLRGRDLAVVLAYDRSGPRYRGDISIQPLEIAAAPIALTASVAFERNRIDVTAARFTAGSSQVDLAGSLEDLASPHAAFQYKAHITNADATRLLDTELLARGTAELTGQGTWQGGSRFAIAGNLHAYGLEYRDRYVRLRDFRADGPLTADPAGVRVAHMHLAGAAVIERSTLPVDAHIATVTLRGKDLELGGLALSVLNGGFKGTATLRDLQHYAVNGEITGFDARRVVAIYSPEPLPWNGLASGSIQLSGTFRHSDQFRAATALDVGPAPDSAPVHGSVQANYEALTETLDLGRSTLTLPHSRADVTGAIGRELRVRLETRDLGDLLPALGQSPASFPVRLQSGSAVFEGKVRGNLGRPQIEGHLQAAQFSYGATRFDAFAADVAASPENVALRHATAAQGGLHAQFEFAVALHNWSAEDGSAIFGNGTIRNASLAELAGALGRQSLALSGTGGAIAQVSGSVGNPLVTATVDAAHGEYRGEPFDSISARVTYTNRMLQLAVGEIVAGAKQAHVEATFEHAPGHFDTGRLRFQVSTNNLALEQIRTLAEERPGITGTAQATAHGTVELVAGRTGELPIRVDDLHADVTARGLQLSGQALGNLHLTANSQGQTLKAHLESDFAASTIRGDGQWRLEGDYPGSATVAFSSLSLAQLRAWIASSPDSFASGLAGSAEGSLRLDGPALKPQAIKAELRIPKLEIRPGTSQAAEGFVVHNSGDIVASMANSIIAVESARLTGRNTDLRITGKVSLAQKNALDVRVAGKADLAALHDWNRDFTASGTVTADTAVRGSFSAPQISGRLEFQQAAFNIVDVPNGISNANGVILFTGDRASFQSFSGETGGGKIRLSGFVAYGGDGPMVYRLRANAQEVRVRYPEGVSTVANTNLSLTGTNDRSMLAGTITILRTGFNPQSDFSSVIAQSAEPVRTPSARTGFLGGLNFDVQIGTAPDVQVQSSLTQDVQVEANLRLRGTASNPALLGRVNVTHGQVVFFGTRYNISQGSIAFYNPLAVEPVLDVDLETKARGIEVTLNVAGRLNKLNLTPRSDPPLQFNEIVALLATGRAPTADTALLSGQNTAAPSFQQMGASALLGQAIASPVTGRLQRFFGVSRLRIDPTLPGVEYNPQARLTLEQQVTQDITFTYITDVTSTNPQVVSVEWAFAKQWSVVAQREENGMIGMDIFFKKRF